MSKVVLFGVFTERTFPLSVVFTSISIELTFANFLNRTALPSITGFDANAPIFPNPRTAVPFDITATKLPKNGSIGESTAD